MRRQGGNESEEEQKETEGGEKKGKGGRGDGRAGFGVCAGYKTGNSMHVFRYVTSHSYAIKQSLGPDIGISGTRRCMRVYLGRMIRQG